MCVLRGAGRGGERVGEAERRLWRRSSGWTGGKGWAGRLSGRRQGEPAAATPLNRRRRLSSLWSPVTRLPGRRWPEFRSLAASAAAAPLPMSLPVVLPGSCCPMARLSVGPEAARHCSVGAAVAAAQELPPPIRPRWSRGGLQQPRPRPAALSPEASRRAAASSTAGPGLLPARPLLSLGLLQLILGCCMVALSFGALSLSSSPQVKNSCPFWAGSSVSGPRRGWDPFFVYAWLSRTSVSWEHLLGTCLRGCHPL